MQQCFLTHIDVNVKLFTCPQKFVVTPEFCMMARPGTLQRLPARPGSHAAEAGADSQKTQENKVSEPSL